jgi:hypothetical protein
MPTRTLALLWGTLFVTAACLTILTLRDYGIASDVPNYFTSSLLQIEWVRTLFGLSATPEAGSALSAEAIQAYWRWWPVRVPHPPLSRELGGLSYVVFSRLADPLSAYRVGVALVYALLVSGCGTWVAWSSRSLLAGVAAGVATLTVPALFAYGHLALTDMYLAAFWFGSVAALDVYVSTRTRGWLWASGLFLGAALATKFTGLLLIPVLIAWLAIRRSLRVRDVAPLLAGAVLVFFAANPALWAEPVRGVRDYLASGLGRVDDAGTQLQTYYFGRVYSFRPPWHYPFVWTAIVIPIPWLMALGFGFTRVRHSRIVQLALLNIGVVYGVLLLPLAPLHDGVRLFLPAFPFLCVVAGMGVKTAADAIYSRLPAGHRVTFDPVAALVLLGFVALPAYRTGQVHPYQLSYFNALVGGIRGAQARGLEVTGLKEVLSPSVLDDLADAVPAGALIDGGFFMEEMCFYQAIGMAPRAWQLESELRNRDSGEPEAWVCRSADSFVTIRLPRTPREREYMFVLNRPGQFRATERALVGHGGAPFYQLSVQGVPLFMVYRLQR